MAVSQMVDTWKDKLQSHFGCVALVALLQIPGMRTLPCHERRLDPRLEGDYAGKIRTAPR
jgi:hypothetical protein